VGRSELDSVHCRAAAWATLAKAASPAGEPCRAGQTAAANCRADHCAGIFPFPYVVNAFAALAQAEVHEGATGRFPLPISSHVGLSFLFDLLLALEPLAAAALAWYLLSGTQEGGTRSIGLDRSDPRQDLALVLPVFLFCFLVPEFGTSILLHAAHVHSIVPASQHLPGYFSIVGIANALTAGVAEEIVVLGFLVRRLEQHGLRPAVVVALAVLVRVSYHLYYGWGVLPIAAWALASVLMYRRYRRLAPFIAVHVLGHCPPPRSLLRIRTARCRSRAVGPYDIGVLADVAEPLGDPAHPSVGAGVAGTVAWL
jgi:membrane protease YdiL (CAAX protease family)